MSITSAIPSPQLMRIACDATNGLREDGHALVQYAQETLPDQDFDVCVSFGIAGASKRRTGHGAASRVDVLLTGDTPDEAGRYEYRAQLNSNSAKVMQSSYFMLPFFKETWIVGFPVYRKYLDALSIAVHLADQSADCRVIGPSV